MREEAATVAQGGLRRRWGMPRFGYGANRLMLWVGLRGLWAGYALVWLAAVYFLVFAPTARRGSMTYLERLRPGRGLLRRWWETYRHLVAFGFLLLDRAVMLAGPEHGFAMSCEGEPHLREAMAAQRGLILLTGHFGNAEAAAPYMQRLGFTWPMHLVMYRDAEDSTEQFHTEHRKLLAKMEVITTTDALAAGVKMIRVLLAGEVVAMRADRTVGGRGVGAELLGGKVELPAGPFVAAALSGAPVVSVYTCRLGYRKYVCVISAPRSYGEATGAEGGTRDQRSARAAADYAGFLEELLRKYPYQWGNFYDFWGTQAGKVDMGEMQVGGAT